MCLFQRQHERFFALLFEILFIGRLLSLVTLTSNFKYFVVPLIVLGYKFLDSNPLFISLL
jgi:cytochrome c-type biogenesis protein CcmE